MIQVEAAWSSDVAMDYALARNGEQNQGPRDGGEAIPPKLRLLITRLRYDEIRRNLDPERELDRGLYTELSRTLRAIDHKIAEHAAG